MSYDTGDRLTNAGYSYDDLGRTLTIPAQDTAAPSTGTATTTYYTNDMARSISQGRTTATNTLDVMTDRFSAYTTTTGGTTTNKINHYSNDSDSPSWSAEGPAFTRIIIGLNGLAAQFTGTASHLEWQITNLHGDVVAVAQNGFSGLSAPTRTTNTATA